MSFNDYIYWQTLQETGKTPEEIYEYEHPEVVRCRDCRYCTTDIIVLQTNSGYERVINLCQCPRHKEEWSVDKDWYCADGERKESE